MWAQDAAAMYGYAGASAAATTLTPFNTPPQTTNPAGTANQAAAVSQATSTRAASTTVPKVLQGLAAGGPAQWLLDLLNSVPVQNFEHLMLATAGYQGLFSAGTFLVSGVSFLISPEENPWIQSALVLSAAAAAPAAATAASDVSGITGGAGASLAGSVGGADAAADLGRAAAVGGLSVPQAWGTAAPEIRLAATGLPMVSAGEPSGMLGGMPAIGPIGSIVNAPRSAASSLGGAVRAQAGGEPGPKERTRGSWRGFDLLAADPQAPLSEREQLIALRKGIAELAKERDLLKRSATLLIKEALQR